MDGYAYDLLRFQRDAGMISPELMTAFEHELARGGLPGVQAVLEAGPGGIKGLTRRGGLRGRVGGVVLDPKAQVRYVDPIQLLVSQTRDFIRNASLNRAKLQLLDYARRIPEGHSLQRAVRVIDDATDKAIKKEFLEKNTANLQTVYRQLSNDMPDSFAQGTAWEWVDTATGRQMKPTKSVEGQLMKQTAEEFLEFKLGRPVLTDKNIVTVREGGHTVRMQVDDVVARMFEALEPQVSSAMTRLAAAPAQLFRGGIVYNPIFPPDGHVQGLVRSHSTDTSWVQRSEG